MKKVIVVSCFVFVIAGLLHIANIRDAKLESISDCVANTAQAEGYAGNAYSKEAWSLFVDSCK